MRIIAGEFRGRRLQGPRGAGIRPTLDRVREAVFSMIADRVPDSRVLDLFAGTGAMGFEALSRGAGYCVFVDQSEAAVRLIRENASLLGVHERSKVIRASAASAIKRLEANGETFDIVFMDPPYGEGRIESALAELDLLTGLDATAVVERSVKENAPALPALWKPDRERKYGDTLISIYSKQ